MATQWKNSCKKKTWPWQKPSQSVGAWKQQRGNGQRYLEPHQRQHPKDTSGPHPYQHLPRMWWQVPPEGNAQPTTWLAYNLTCHQCQQIGHLAKACRSRQPRQPPPQTPNHPSTKAILSAPPTTGIPHKSTHPNSGTLRPPNQPPQSVCTSRP